MYPANHKGPGNGLGDVGLGILASLNELPKKPKTLGILVWLWMGLNLLLATVSFLRDKLQPQNQYFN